MRGMFEQQNALPAQVECKCHAIGVEIGAGAGPAGRAFREVRLRDEWVYLFLEGVSRVVRWPSGPRAHASRGGLVACGAKHECPWW